MSYELCVMNFLVYRPRKGAIAGACRRQAGKKNLPIRLSEALPRCFPNFHAQSIGSATGCRFTDFVVFLAFIAA